MFVIASCTWARANVVWLDIYDYGTTRAGSDGCTLDKCTWLPLHRNSYHACSHHTMYDTDGLIIDSDHSITMCVGGRLNAGLH
jgi:hypothetical protein